jgi:RNA-directed DNA polymerase
MQPILPTLPRRRGDTNIGAPHVNAFRFQVIRHWHRALRRRSQRSSLNWKRMLRLAKRWLPPVRVTHPWPDARFHARIQAKSPVS